MASARKGSPYLAPRRSWGLRRFSVPMLLRPQPDGWVFYLRLRRELTTADENRPIFAAHGERQQIELILHLDPEGEKPSAWGRE